MAPLDLTFSDLEKKKFKVNQNSKRHISQRSQVRPYITVSHQWETIHGESNDNIAFDMSDLERSKSKSLGFQSHLLKESSVKLPSAGHGC